MSVEVVHEPEQQRYAAYVAAELAGFTEYVVTAEPALITFVHTEVGDAFGGQGVGGAIARAALDDVRARGTHRVVPQCPFIRGWIDKHPDYADLVAEPG
ncbi:MAG: GNAT family N-acetyltransferase [Actinobacteria bacterium]|uniref:Unannotated protein n=1 Tax=freshwater metagenome TaxID=449393 RepID=A0A6J6NME8_9ZZZZ|nr:GNAT family N-acetyltransferase [Actinomycetota bacterium]